MKKVRVNVRSVVNMDGVKRVKRNGRDVVIVPSATLPDDIVMNGIKYPADEIAKSFETLNRTPAPYGHPKVNGKFVSASDPEGINLTYIGAHNENVRRHDGRVFLDKVIDVEVANRTETGKAVLNAINKGEPIHTSTGLLCDLDAANGEDHEHTARNLYFDHDAILLNEEGAATPDQGVGMLVNSNGETEEIEVVNASAEEAMRDLDWAVDSAMRAADKLKDAPRHERLKQLLLSLLGLSDEAPETGQVEMNNMADETKLNELTKTVDDLKAQMDGIGDKIAEAVTNAVKPLTDNLDEIKANQKEKDDAEKADLVAKIVKANLLDEDAAKELTLNAARKLAEKAKPGKAAPVANGAYSPEEGDEWAGYSLNSAIDGEKKKEAA